MGRPLKGGMFLKLSLVSKENRARRGMMIAVDFGSVCVVSLLSLMSLLQYSQLSFTE